MKSFFTIPMITKQIIFASILFFCSVQLNAQWKKLGNIEGNVSNFEHFKSKNNRIWMNCFSNIAYQNYIDTIWHYPIPNMISLKWFRANEDTIAISYIDSVFGLEKLSFSIDNGNTFPITTTISSLPGMHDIFWLGNKLAMHKSEGPIEDTLIYTTDFGSTWQNSTCVKHFYPHRNSNGHNPIIGYDEINNYLSIASSIKISYDQLATANTIFNAQLGSILSTYNTKISNSHIYIDDQSYLYVTTDGGATFDTITPPSFFSNYYTFGDTILGYKSANFLSQDSLFISYNKGLTWTSKNNINISSSFGAYFKELVMTNANEVYCNTMPYALPINVESSKRFFILQDSVVSSGKGGKNSTFIKLHENNGIFFTYNYSNIYKSVDSGSTWIKTSPNCSQYSWLSTPLFLGDTIIHIANNVQLQKTITNYSYNNGISWDTLVNEPSKNVYFKNRTFVSDSFYSINAGLTWQLNNAFLPSSLYSSNIVYSDKSMNNLYGYNKHINGSNLYMFYEYNFLNHSWNLIDTNTINGIAVDTSIYFNIVYKEGSFWLANIYSPTNVFNINPNLYPLQSAYSYNGHDWFLCLSSSITPFLNSGGFENIVKIANIYYGSSSGKLLYSFDGKTWNFYKSYDENPFYIQMKNLLSYNNKLYSAADGFYFGEYNENLNSHEGIVFFDNNNNNIQDAGELGIANCVIGSSQIATTISTDSAGHFGCINPIISDTIKPQLPLGLTSTPTFIVASSLNPTNNNFAINAPTAFCNYAGTINATLARSGFGCKLFININNLGNLQGNDSLVLVLDTTYNNVSFNINPNYSNGNIYKWSITSLALFASIDLTITAKINASALPADSLISIIKVISSITDIDSTNNIDTLFHYVYSSYDPNLKICEQGNTVDLVKGREIIYTIHFQNEGNFNTSFIKIVDELSKSFDASSIKLLASSHPCSMKMQNNFVQFDFKQISLTPKFLDEVNSQGFVSFKIKLAKDVAIGDSLFNIASIYFDFNAPISTNECYTKNPEFWSLQNNQIQNPINNPYTIIPNPAIDKIIVQCSTSNIGNQFSIFNSEGSFLKQGFIQYTSTPIDIKALHAGTYIILIGKGINRKYRKFIKL